MSLTPKRLHEVTAALISIVAVILVGWLAVAGVVIAQGSLIMLVGGAGAYYLHMQTQAPGDVPPVSNRRTSDAPPTAERR